MRVHCRTRLEDAYVHHSAGRLGSIAGSNSKRESKQSKQSRQSEPRKSEQRPNSQSGDWVKQTLQTNAVNFFLAVWLEAFKLQAVSVFLNFSISLFRCFAAERLTELLAVNQHCYFLTIHSLVQTLTLT